MYGHSSGAGLALHAAAAGLTVSRLVLHDPPYTPDGDEEARQSAREYGEELKARLSEGRRGDAVELFFAAVGMPWEMVDEMRQTPRWAELEEIAPTLANDSEVMGDVGRDGTIPVNRAGAVTVPALVLTGGPPVDDRRGPPIGRGLAAGAAPRSGGPGTWRTARGARACAEGVPRRLVPEERSLQCPNRKP